MEEGDDKRINQPKTVCENEDLSNEMKPEECEGNIIRNFTLQDKKRLYEVCSIRKNLALVAVCNVLVSIPMFGFVPSTTSLLDDKGLGVTSLAATSLLNFLGSTFLLSYANKVWGIRKMVSTALILPIPFIVSFVYPSWGTTLPAGLLLGLGQSFSTSLYMYGNAIGHYYNKLTMANSDLVLFIINGIVTSTFNGGLFFGSVISFTALNNGIQVNSSTTIMNFSYDVCGIQYCNQELKNLPTMEKPESWRYYMLVSIFSCFAVVGGTLTLFVRDFSVELGNVPRKKSDYFAVMKETLQLMQKPRGFLLVFLNVFTGLEQAFIMADYTHAFVSCFIGIPKIGLIMLTYGGVQIIVSVLQAFFVKLFGRIAVIAFGVLLLMTCFMIMFLWHPDPGREDIFFLTAFLWSAGDAILYPTTFAMYGILFEDNIEGALTLANFWWGIGSTIAYVWSQFLCVAVKLYITIAIGCLGLVCYIMLEVMLRKKAKRDQ